jgi:hypothetical protein
MLSWKIVPKSLQITHTHIHMHIYKYIQHNIYICIYIYTHTLHTTKHTKLLSLDEKSVQKKRNTFLRPWEDSSPLWHIHIYIYIYIYIHIYTHKTHTHTHNKHIPTCWLGQKIVVEYISILWTNRLWTKYRILSLQLFIFSTYKHILMRIEQPKVHKCFSFLSKIVYSLQIETHSICKQRNTGKTWLYFRKKLYLLQMQHILVCIISHKHTHTLSHKCICVYVYTYTHICTYIYIHVICIYIHTHMYIYIHVYTCIYM